MTINVGINGMGRIGRMVIRAIIESQNTDIKIKHINNRSNSEASCTLIKYDSVHGKFNADLNYDENHLIINNDKISFSQESKIEDIDWKKFGVDYVFECTGKFNSKEKLLAHINNGAKKVIVSAPCTNADFTVVQGVNQQELSNDHVVISNASCTTNCLSPVAYVIDKEFGIENGYMTTIHSYTGDQSTVDTFHKDLRRARAAAHNIIPTSTGAAKAVGLVLPHLKGKLDGTALRVPTPNVSLVDFKFNTKNPISVKALNSKFQEYANGSLKGILGVDTDPKVSSDYNHDSRSSILDLTETTAVSDTFGRILTWYDNEWGFSNRMLETSQQVCKL